MLAGLLVSRPGVAAEIRAAYFYHYMSPGHVDSLARAGFNRAIVRIVADTLTSGQAARIVALVERGARRGVTVIPDVLFQSPPRVESRPHERRYVWGSGTREPRVACPLDTAYWKGALFDRWDEILALVPSCRSIAVDFEVYGAGLHHYAGACLCPSCIGAGDAARLGRAAAAGHEKRQASALGDFLERALARFAARHPKVEIGVLDLDLDSFVHRSFARALDRARIPTVDYAECSYTDGGRTLAAARRRLDALGLTEARLVGGLWLKRWTPGRLTSGVRSVVDRADGYFVFTTYSLWQPVSRLTGPYVLEGTQAEYWRALEEANRTP